ncbi:hypothetical protein POUND7_009248 [Theobroma cacao]
MELVIRERPYWPKELTPTLLGKIWDLEAKLKRGGQRALGRQSHLALHGHPHFLR